jgi:mannose-6-phosphate isomerase-like protein (cupin superfamily)
MRNVLLFSCLLAGLFTCDTFAQAPAAPAQQKPAPAPTPAPAPATQKPAAPAPATPAPATQKPATTPARRAPAASARSGMAITVTSPQGATISGVQVALMGPTERGGETDGSGQVNFPGLQAGTYRLRFSGDKVTAFEKEVAVVAGRIADVDVTLNPAPEPKVIEKTIPAPAPAAAVTGPKGQPVTYAIGDLLEKEFVGRQPRRETLLSCSGSERAAMIQLNEPMPERLYENADAIYYVLGGEGTLLLNGKETKLGLNGFASVPRGTPHSFTKRGNRLLVLLSVLSGEPCEQAR